jgi:hypothetical protein
MARAQVIIVNPEAVDRYKLFYRFHAEVNAEAPSYIKKCIKDGNYAHEVPTRAKMGGVLGNKRRP